MIEDFREIGVLRERAEIISDHDAVRAKFEAFSRMHGIGNFEREGEFYTDLGTMQAYAKYTGVLAHLLDLPKLEWRETGTGTTIHHAAIDKFADVVIWVEGTKHKWSVGTIEQAFADGTAPSPEAAKTQIELWRAKQVLLAMGLAKGVRK